MGGSHVENNFKITDVLYIQNSLKVHWHYHAFSFKR